MPHLSMKKLHRGPVVNILISVLKVDGDSADIQTEEIDVDGQVVVVLKFKCGINRTLITYLRMKRNATLSYNPTIMITGSFKEQFSCSAKWVEAEMAAKGYDKNVPINNQYTLFYFIEVNITVRKAIRTLMVPNYNLYGDTEFTDFELQATDGNVAVHKTLLLAQSDVFKAIMRGEWKEKAEGHLKIEGVTVQTLQHLKDYMYLGILPDEGLQALLVFAARYLIDNLVLICTEKLVRTMKPEDFNDLVKLACQHNIPDLVKALVLRILDDIRNGIHQLKVIGQETKDDEKENQS